MKKQLPQIRAVWVDTDDYIPYLRLTGREIITRKCSMCGNEHTEYADSFPKWCPKCYRRIVMQF